MSNHSHKVWAERYREEAAHRRAIGQDDIADDYEADALLEDLDAELSE